MVAELVERMPMPARRESYLARVRLPDGSDQDVLTHRERGRLVAELIDGLGTVPPAVHLDLSNGSTPTVRWSEGHEPPLDLSLELVAKVCDALARAARGLEPDADPPAAPAETPEPSTSPAVKPTARRFWPALLAGMLLAAALALHRPAPPPLEPAQVAVAPASRERAPEPLPVLELEPAQVVASLAVPPEPRKPARRGHGVRLTGTTVQHHVAGLEPGQGRVALRTGRGLEVSIDGLWVGMTPIRPLALSAGAHVLELRKDEKASRTLDLDIGAGDQTTLFFEFD